MVVLRLAYKLDLTERESYTSAASLFLLNSHWSPVVRHQRWDQVQWINRMSSEILSCFLCYIMLPDTDFMGLPMVLSAQSSRICLHIAGLRLIGYPVLADLSKLLSGELLVRAECQVGDKGGQITWKGHNVFLCQMCYPSLILHTLH